MRRHVMSRCPACIQDTTGVCCTAWLFPNTIVTQSVSYLTGLQNQLGCSLLRNLGLAAQFEHQEMCN